MNIEMAKALMIALSLASYYFTSGSKGGGGPRWRVLVELHKREVGETANFK